MGIRKILSKWGERISEKKSKKWFLESIKKVEVVNGDIIVFNYPKTLSSETHINFKNAIHDIFKRRGFDVQVLLLKDGMKIETVLSKKGVINQESSI